MKFQTPRGTRDFLPEQMMKRQYVFDTIRKVFENWGFDPLETPAFEDWELLATKSGDDVRNEIYYFKDKSERDLGLRFDLTVPLARVVAINPQLSKPFKRYHIGRVWRYDRPGSGRYREFWQADVDIVGSASSEADAECVASACNALEQLGFKDFTVRISSRKVIEGFVSSLKINNITDVLRSIDKIEKIGEGAVAEELKAKNIDAKSVQKIIKFIKSGSDAAKDFEGYDEVEKIVGCLKIYGYEKYAKVDLSLVRGLEYYTGPVFEIVTKDAKNSIGGGGRYDNLIAAFGGKTSPATGISLGVERITELMEEKKMFAAKKTNVKVFIITIGDVKKEVAGISKKLRSKNISNEYDLMSRSLSKQLDYANSKGVPFVIFIGEKELKSGRIKIRNMKSGEEKELSMNNLEDEIYDMLGL